MTAIGNIFAGIPAPSAAEQVLPLLASQDVRIERIVSTGQASPDGFWYDQKDAEWVLVLAGSAALPFEDKAEPLHLGLLRTNLSLGEADACPPMTS